MKNIEEIFENNKFALSLAFIAFSIWLFSIKEAQNNLYAEGIGDIGLITILPITYFIAFSLLTISFLVALRVEKINERILSLQIFFLILFLFSSPILIEVSRSRWAYTAYGFADYILRNGSIDPSLIFYHNWPSFVVYIVSISSISNLDPIVLINIFPTVANVLFLFPLYMILKTLSNGSDRMWLGIWVFYVASWVGQDYLSPQSFGFFLFLLIMAFFFKFFLKNSNTNERDKIKIEYLFIILILFLTLASGHLLTSLVITGMVLFTYVFRCHRKFSLFPLFLIIILSWTIYGAETYFERNFSNFISESLSFGTIFNANIVDRVSGTAGHIFVTKITILYSFLILLFALVGFIVSLNYNKDRWADRRVIVTLAGILIGTAGFSYGGEIFMRVYNFGLVFISYFISYIYNSKKLLPILIIFLILFAPSLNVISSHGNEKFQQISQGEISGADFLYSNAQNSFIKGGFPWGSYKRSGDVFDALYYWGWRTRVFPIYTEEMLSDHDYRGTSYLLINRGDMMLYMMYTNTSLEEFFAYKNEVAISYSKIYTNSDFDIFK